MHTLLTFVSVVAIIVLFLGMTSYHPTMFVAGLIGCVTVGLIHVYRGIRGWD